MVVLNYYYGTLTRGITVGTYDMDHLMLAWGCYKTHTLSIFRCLIILVEKNGKGNHCHRNVHITFLCIYKTQVVGKLTLLLCLYWSYSFYRCKQTYLALAEWFEEKRKTRDKRGKIVRVTFPDCGKIDMLKTKTWLCLNYYNVTFMCQTVFY